MDPENLRRKLVLPGYQHPETIKTNRANMYKTFSNVESTATMNSFGKTNADKRYATMSYNNLDNDKCPICESKIIEKCQCSFSDRTCENKHIWYIQRNGDVKIGNPHK